MYNCVSLTRKNLDTLFELNSRRKGFNSLNEDVEEYYRNMGFTQQFLLHRKIKLLKSSDKIIGYLWLSRETKNSFVINSIFAEGEEDKVEKYAALIHSLGYKSRLLYTCEKNPSNYEVLSKVGFSKKEGTYEMKAQVVRLQILYDDKDIMFEQFQKGLHEEVRCRIQNEVFKNDSRVPLTKEDISYDQIQPYYFDKGSVLIKKGDSYIGYGQIIFNEDVPTIVNIGLLDSYRGSGYGRALMCHLFKILEEQGAKEVTLRVSSSNEKAINLYKSLGFTIVNEAHMWEYKKNE